MAHCKKTCLTYAHIKVADQREYTCRLVSSLFDCCADFYVIDKPLIHRKAESHNDENAFWS